MALTDNLIAALELDEASGNAIDSHGANDFSDNNTVGAGTGLVHANARDFEAANDEYFSLADNTDLSLSDIDCTVEAWVNLESKDEHKSIYARWSATGNEWLLRYNASSDRFELYVSNGTDFPNVVANNLGIPSTATWYHIIAWHDSVNNLIGIEVNDGTADTAAYANGIADSATPTYIGRADHATANRFDGLMGPIRFWKRMLTSAERTSLYNGGAGLAYSAFTAATGPIGARSICVPHIGRSLVTGGRCG